MTEQRPTPKVDELLGIDPDWTGDLTTDEYIQRARGRVTEQPDSPALASECACSPENGYHDHDYCPPAVQAALNAERTARAAAERRRESTRRVLHRTDALYADCHAALSAAEARVAALTAENERMGDLRMDDLARFTALRAERDDALAFAESWRSTRARYPTPAEWNARLAERDSANAKVAAVQALVDDPSRGPNREWIHANEVRHVLREAL